MSLSRIRGSMVVFLALAGCQGGESGGPLADEALGSVTQAASPAPSVLVTNSTDAQAIPTRAVGTTTVVGGVIAAQSGSWTVKAQQDNPWAVSILGNSQVTASQDGEWSVNIANTPAVDVASMPAVEVSSMPAVEVYSMPLVNVASLPAVNVASMPAMNVTTTSGNPLLVRGVNEAARRPFQKMISVQAPFMTPSVPVVVPAGYRLVLEHVSWYLHMSPGDSPHVELVNVDANNTKCSFGSSAKSMDSIFVEDRPTRCYVETPHTIGNPTPLLNVSYFIGPDSGALHEFSGHVTLIGYLVEIPPE